MKRIIGLLTAVTLMVLWTAPVLAAGLSISPPTVEFDVPANGSAEVEFLVYDFTGDLGISLEDIPLRVEPTTVPVTAKEGGTRVVLTFYGDESLGSEIYEGKIRFLAMTGGSVAFGIKVRATINHIASGQPVAEATDETPVAEVTEENPTPPAPPGPPPAPEGATGGLSPNTVMFIFIGLLCLAVLAMAIQAIRVLARRRQH